MSFGNGLNSSNWKASADDKFNIKTNEFYLSDKVQLKTNKWYERNKVYIGRLTDTMKGTKCKWLIRAAVILYITITILIMVEWLPSESVNQGSNREPPGRQEMSIAAGKLVLQANDPSITYKAESSIDTESNCTFRGTFEENLNKLRNLPFTHSQRLMNELGFNRVPTNVLNTTLPVLVTGIDAKFYDVVQGLVKTIHQKLMPKYPDLKFILYDMGMTQTQHEKTVKYCRCEVKKFPLDQLPKHVSTLGNFAFKPIIANYVFQEFGHVWWVDSSVRFMSNDLERPMKYLQENGALFFTYGPVLNVALHTHKDTFQIFGEDPCPYMYFGEIEAGNVAFINNDVGRLILNRWVSCALDASCITPEGASKACRSPAVMSKDYISRCHRYDQSALSIILRRLYHKQNDYPMVDNPFRIIQVIRRQVVHYFP